MRETQKKILDMVKKRNSIYKSEEEANENARLAVEAITAGRGSEEWKRYMLQFVEKNPDAPDEPLNPAHLARLLGEDDTADDYKMNRRRAYLLGNAVCGGLSPTGAVPAGGNGRGLDFTVDTIDEGL
jgi:hypothetical protein